MKQKFHDLKQHYYICYTLLFLIMCIAVFGVFWYNGKSFVWVEGGEDGLSQHLNAYIYYGRYLRSIVRSVLFDHTLSIPAFSMSIGYGSDILSTLSYYVIGDPICALTVFVPTRYMAYFYDFAVILRLFLSGLVFSKLCFYVNQRQNNKVSHTAIMIGTFIYVFCGYALYASVRHPYFINPMIYFPLILLGIEMILDKKKPYVFTVAVFLSAISNFYFFYMIAILTVLYVAWRVISKYHRKEIKEALGSLGKITGYSILGTAMSAVVFIPTLLCFLGDARSESGYMHSIFYTLAEYQKNISGFIAVNEQHDWIILGYAAVALLAVFLLFMQRGKFKNFKIAFIAMAIMLALPIVGRIMNGFSYVSSRWVWGFSLLVGYIVVLMWDELLAASSQTKLKLLLCLCVYFALCMLMTKSRTIDFLIPMILAFLFMCLLLFRRGRYQTAITTACILCVFINVAANAGLMYSPRFNNYIAEFADQKDIMDNYRKKESVALDKLTDSEESLSRYTGETSKNRTLYTGLHSTQFYWSLSNGNITDFQLENGLKFGVTFNYSGLNSRTGLTTLANVKYHVQINENFATVPYGFQKVGSQGNYKFSEYVSEKFGKNFDKSTLSKEEKDLIKEEYITTYTVYENEYALPFGYTYSNVISRENYDQLTPIQKQEAMLQGVVLEDDQARAGTMPISTSRSCMYSIGKLDGVEWDGNTITVTKENGKATLSFSGIENAENYLYIKGLDYVVVSPVDEYTDAEWKLKSTYDKNELKYQERFWEEPEEVSLEFSSKNIDKKSISTNISHMTPYYAWYNNQTDYLVNLYYDELPRQSITITFPTMGTYTYEDLEVLCQPMDSYETQVNALKTDTLENVDFHDSNAAFATSEITGDISLNQEKYLLLTIPYTSGWTAYVDGEEQELLQANTMYMALDLAPGNHSITLRYHTPGKTIGLWISIISTLVIIFLYIFTGRENNGGRKRPRKRRRVARITARNEQGVR